MIYFDIITLFPESLKSYLGVSILARAQKKKLIKINLINPRKFATDKHKTVDDSPYGGGPGMVLKFEPIAKAVAFAKLKVSARGRSALGGKSKKLKVRTILFSTRGKKLTSSYAKQLALCDKLILICGRYEGVDERVAKYIADEEMSIGDYVLEGGELPALVVIDAVSRHIPGVLGKRESLEEIKGSYPVYTRPDVVVLQRGKKVKKLKVPKVLLLGDHKEISEWRRLRNTN